MNSFSLSKLFTVVLFVTGTQSQVSFAAGSLSESGEKGAMSCRTEVLTGESCKADVSSTNCQAQLKACNDMKDSLGEANAAKEAKTECNAAMKEWREKASKGSRACSAFDNSAGNCTDKVRACQSKISGTVAATTNESGDQNLEIIQQIIKQKLNTSSDALAADVANGVAPCVKQFDAKTKKENEKEFTKEKRELEARVKKETDEQTKQNEKLREKKDEITKKISELDAKIKKSAEARAVKAGDAKTAYQKKVVESAKIIRNLGTAILQEDQKLTKARFVTQTSLLDQTSEKITNRCKQQLISVRSALVSNGTGAATTADAKQLAELKSSMGTGAKGTANLNAYLKQIKDACFQTENTKTQNIQLQATQDAESSAARIKELNSSIDDENKSLKIAKEANDTADTQAATEKKNEDTTKATDENNLSTELQNFQDSINEKIKNSKAEAAKITEEIATLTLKKNADVEPAFDDAADAINLAEQARVNAVGACSCDTKNVDTKTNCGMLNMADTNPEVKKGSGRGASGGKQ